jgi:hypothetical protein
MQSLHNLLRLEETAQRNAFYTISDSFSTCIEKCDSANLKECMFNLLENILGQAGEYYTNPDIMLGKAN